MPTPETKKWFWRAAWALVVVAALFDLSLFLPLYGETCAENEYTNAKECADHHLGPYLLFWIAQVIDNHDGFVVAVATAFVAAFTWTLYRASSEQARLTREAIEEAKKSSERQLRAYVNVSSAEIIALNPNGEIQIEIVIQNFGQSPADNLQFMVAIRAYDFPYRGLHIIVPAEAQPTMSLPPTGKVRGTYKETFDADQINAAKTGEGRAIYFIGDVSYVDAFGEDRTTHFRYYLGGDYKLSKIPLALARADRGNDAT